MTRRRKKKGENGAGVTTVLWANRIRVQGESGVRRSGLTESLIEIPLTLTQIAKQKSNRDRRRGIAANQKSVILKPISDFINGCQTSVRASKSNGR